MSIGNHSKLCHCFNEYNQNHFRAAIYSIDRENVHTGVICPLTIEANDTLLCKSTKTHSISTNITLVLRCLRPHCANFQQPGQLLVKIDLVKCKQ